MGFSRKLNILTYRDNLYLLLVPSYCFQVLKTLVREMKQKFSRRLAINLEPPHVFGSQDRSAVRFRLTLLSVYYAREAWFVWKSSSILFWGCVLWRFVDVSWKIMKCCIQKLEYCLLLLIFCVHEGVLMLDHAQLFHSCRGCWSAVTVLCYIPATCSAGMQESKGYMGLCKE